MGRRCPAGGQRETLMSPRERRKIPRLVWIVGALAFFLWGWAIVRSISVLASAARIEVGFCVPGVHIYLKRGEWPWEQQLLIDDHWVTRRARCRRDLRGAVHLKSEAEALLLRYLLKCRHGYRPNSGEDEPFGSARRRVSSEGMVLSTALRIVLLGSDLVNRIGNDAEGQYEPERIVDQGHGAEPLVPAGRSLVLGIDGKRNPADLGCNGEGSPARRQEQFAAEALSLHRQVNRQASEPVDGHVVARQLSGHQRWHAGKLDGPGANGVVAQDARGLGCGHCDEGSGATTLVVLPRVTAKVLVEIRRATVESFSIMMPTDRFPSPVDQGDYARAAPRRAAASKAGVGSGGLSSSSRTRRVSRSVRTTRSARSRTS